MCHLTQFPPGQHLSVELTTVAAESELLSVVAMHCYHVTAVCDALNTQHTTHFNGHFQH